MNRFAQCLVAASLSEAIVVWLAIGSHPFGVLGRALGANFFSFALVLFSGPLQRLGVPQEVALAAAAAGQATIWLGFFWLCFSWGSHARTRRAAP